MGNFQHTEKHAEALDKIFETVSTFAVPKETTQNEAWEIFKKSIGRQNRSREFLPFGLIPFLKIAASFLLLIIASWLVFSLQGVEIQTARGELKTIVLPDHSTVVLNAGSLLRYNTFAFYFTRHVHLNGEGFFSVQKGSAFEVISPNGVTRVLGTQFNIFSRTNRYEVSCVEGKVRVDDRRGASAILTAKLQTRLSDEGLSLPNRFSPEITTAWQQGEFYFENVAVSEVFSALERQYNVFIHYSGDTARTYTGYFTNQNLAEALKLVCLPLQLRYSILKDNSIQISNQ